MTEITPQVGLLASLKELHCSNNDLGDIRCLLIATKAFILNNTLLIYIKKKQRNCPQSLVVLQIWIFLCAPIIGSIIYVCIKNRYFLSSPNALKYLLVFAKIYKIIIGFRWLKPDDVAARVGEFVVIDAHRRHKERDSVTYVVVLVPR